MQIKDFVDPSLALLRDMNEADALRISRPSQFSSRAYVRSAFAYVEGTSWLAKQACLYVSRASSLEKLSVAERTLLADETHELTELGVPRVKPKFLRLEQNLRFTFHMVDKVFKTSCLVDESRSEWLLMKQAISVRNRLTHPKSLSDYQVTPEEVSAVETAINWFNAASNRMLQAMLKSSKPSAA